MDVSEQIEDALDKTIGQKFKAAGAIGLMGLTAALPSAAQAPSSSPDQIASVSHDDFGTNPEDRFLWSIMQLESSGGKNTRHKTMKHGIHAGTHAMGRWGLMPNTIKDVLSRAKLAGKSSPGLEALSNLDNSQMDHFLKQNPKVELAIARRLAHHVLKRQGFDPYRAAYAWTNGHNLSTSEVPTEDVHQSPYVKKFMRINKINPIRPAKPVVKADGSTFREKFGDWHERRLAEAREHAPLDNTVVRDPGRQREDSLDERDEEMKADETADVRQRIKNRIKGASDTYAGGKP